MHAGRFASWRMSQPGQPEPCTNVAIGRAARTLRVRDGLRMRNTRPRLLPAFSVDAIAEPLDSQANYVAPTLLGNLITSIR